MTSKPCPRRPADITAAFISEVLSQPGAAAPVERVELEPTGQQAFTSSLTRVRLWFAGDADAGPASVIVKLSSEIAAVRSMAGEAVERELRFYEELGDDPGISVPRCYHVGRGDDGAYCLVLEDLGAGQIGKSRADHAELLIEALAPFHARYWNGRDLAGMDWLRTDPGEARRYALLLGQALSKLRSLGDRFPDSVRRVAEFLAVLPDTGYALAAPGPLGLVHGDLHLQQVFFPGERGGRFAVFDWQTVTSDGNPLRDVSRPLATSIAPQLRRAHEQGWLARYHELLQAHGVVDFTLEQCLEQYRRSLLTTVLQHVVGAGTGDISHFERRSRETGVDWTDRFFGWVACALEDHDVLGRYCS